MGLKLQRLSFKKKTAETCCRSIAGMESTIHATDELEPANRAVYIYEKEIGRTTTGLLKLINWTAELKLKSNQIDSLLPF